MQTVRLSEIDGRLVTAPHDWNDFPEWVTRNGSWATVCKNIVRAAANPGEPERYWRKNGDGVVSVAVIYHTPFLVDYSELPRWPRGKPLPRSAARVR